jgi:hypothetical protein
MYRNLRVDDHADPGGASRGESTIGSSTTRDRSNGSMVPKASGSSAASGTELAFPI